jgi:hypothetical protein
MAEFWLIEWRDISGDRDRDIKEVAVSPAEAADAVRRILEGEIVIDYNQVAEDGTWPAEAEQDAFACLFEDEDPRAVLAGLREPMELECDEGKIVVTRQWSGRSCRPAAPGRKRSDFRFRKGAGLSRDEGERFRRELIAWLQRVDRNGTFSDEDSAAEGMRPLSIAGAAEIVAGWARDLVEARELRPDQLGQFQPMWWPSSCSDHYARFWQAVQELLHNRLAAGMPEEWPPAADDFVVVTK